MNRMILRLLSECWKQLTLHGARHTFVDMLYTEKSNIREDTVMQLVEHSSRTMSRSYRTNVELDHAEDALSGLERLLPPPGEIVKGDTTQLFISHLL